MPGRVTGGRSVAGIWNATDTRNVIRDWIAEDGDYIVTVNYNLNRFITFSETVKAIPENVVGIAYDPPVEADEPILGPSQHTAFDSVRLSSRSEDYQQFAVNWFASHVLADHIRPRYFVLNPTATVVRTTEKVLDGRLPRTAEDIARLVGADPDILNRVKCIQGDFDPAGLSSAAREVIRNLLEDQGSLNRYLEKPEDFLREWGDRVRPEERKALVGVAQEEPELVRNAFDSLELGASKGDGNTYILIGLDRDTNLPDEKGWEWVHSQLRSFVERNGFLPAFGYYVTEARAYQRVILGPGVTDREVDFLRFHGHDLTDKRDRSAISEPFDPPEEPGGTLSVEGKSPSAA